MKIKNSILKETIQAIRQKGRLAKVVSKSMEKLKSENAKLSIDFIDKIKALSRMVKMHISGAYKVPQMTLLYVVLGLVYFVVPTDSIPDFIPALGFSDDLTVLYFIFKKIESDIAEFVNWEKTNLEVN